MTHLVTGATGGLGLEMARQLVQQGHEVWVHGRSEQSAARARATTGAERAFYADLGRPEQVMAMAEAVIDAGGVDVLTNNAGAFFKDLDHVASGLERHVAINHVGPFLLTNRLLPHIRDRVVMVASDAHKQARPDLDDGEWSTRSWSSMRAYADSKLFNILYARALARRADISVNALHPGFVDTGIGDRGSGGFARFMGRIIKAFGKSPEKAVACQMWAATSDEAKAHTGVYFVKSAKKAPAPLALDDALAERLWTQTEQWASREP